MAVGKEQFAWVANLTQAVLAHLINTKFSCASKAVFDGTKYAVQVVLVTLKLEYCINNMLQDFGTCNRTVLGYMADEQHRSTALLGKLEQRSGALAHLRNASGR